MKKTKRIQGQTSISAYFQTALPTPQAKAPGKRPASATGTIDLTLSDNDDNNEPNTPERKKARTSEAQPAGRIREPLFLRDPSEDLDRPTPGPSAVIPPKSYHTGPKSPMQAFRYDASTSGTSPRTGRGLKKPMESDAKQARREALKRRLLADNNITFERQKKEPLSERAESEKSDIDPAEDRAGIQSGLTTKHSGMTTVAGNANALDDSGPSGLPYTPLEQQVRSLKERYSDTLLMIEVGYKYRFFGEDAKIASKELGIVCYNDRNFLTAGVPTQRRDIHLKKLLAQGHKVGIVGQIETAALKKVSSNRNAPFDRQLTHLYTAATYVDELDSVDDPSLITPGLAPSIICLTEGLLGGMGADERVAISIISVTPSTGDVVWDDFKDNFIRSELETRLAHIKPSEMLLPEKKLSVPTEKILSHFSLPSSSAVSTNSIRVEHFKKQKSYTDAFSHLSDFYTGKARRASESFNTGKLFAIVKDLPQRVCIALAHVVEHLQSFGLAEALTRTEFFSKFTERRHMLLNSNTLANLEIYRNQTDFTTKGSLMWVLDRTKTSFGARLLRSWVGRPLVDVEALRARVDAVEEIISTESTRTREILVNLRDLLKGLPDLARGLSRIQYGKCTPKELSKLLTAFNKMANLFQVYEAPKDIGFKSSVLNDIIYAIPQIRPAMQSILRDINLKKAAEDKREDLWNDPKKYPKIDDAHFSILGVEAELMDQLKLVRKILQKPTAQWMSVAGDEYLIEIKKDDKREIPIDWHLVSSTKSARRYQSPEVRQKLQERAEYQEILEAEANIAFLDFLSGIADDHYVALRNVINMLAVADCLLSMASVASRSDYVKPKFVNDDCLVIENGRHPMVEALRSDPFVPNTIGLGGNETRTKIITGPNMGGKSSAVRMIALIALMAQLGSYVPASSVTMSLLDAILTRMGASDDLTRGRSTFMVEMSETSDILHMCTAKSLIILDELGRGSSTFDGMAIAGAVLDHLVRSINCKTLFITHYPLIATELEHSYPDKVKNLHMGFTEETGIDGVTSITFLYRLTIGVSTGSFGIECGRLANLPEALLETASARAATMRTMVAQRNRVNRSRKLAKLLNELLRSKPSEAKAHIRDIRTVLSCTSNAMS